MFSNYLLLSLLINIFLEIFAVLRHILKINFFHHVLSKNAILIAPNFASYCGVRHNHLPQGDWEFGQATETSDVAESEKRRPLRSGVLNCCVPGKARLLNGAI